MKIKKSKKYVSKSLRILMFLLILLAIIFLGLLLMFRLFVSTFKDDVIDLNLAAAKMRLTSKVFSLTENGNYKEYQKVFSNENRIWVSFEKIPKHMKDAIIAIEDKRFYKHGGIDFIRISSAFANVIIGNKSHGGSSLTQQLVKNITEDSEVSFSRKLREMARAVRLEERSSKDEILESYLNIANFGSGHGVQTAAESFYGKNIWECDIIESAAIAAVTQNPRKYNPLVNPEENKKRREVVINEMFFQKKITKSEYENALKISKNMKFLNSSSAKNKSINGVIRNWYIEMLCRDIINDLASKYKIKKNLAEDILYSGGLKIYACVDPYAQQVAEETVLDKVIMPKDPDLEFACTIVDYTGRILATIGSSKPKNANLIYDRANIARRQPGSTIKPIAVYAPAINMGVFTYSSKIPDKPLKIDIDGTGNFKDWPENWYKNYFGEVILQWAIEKSANAPAAQILNMIGSNVSYRFLNQDLGLKSLDSSDANSLAALAAGGTHMGVTTLEMTAAFQIFGSGGKYHKPKSYFYVTDKEGKIILDNRYNSHSIQAISTESAYVLNRLLRQVIVGPEGTGKNANINDWEIIGKTGTTTDDFDSWFIGASPYSVVGIWTGYDKPKRIKEKSVAMRIFKNITTKLLLNYKGEHEFICPDGVVVMPYCKETGFLSTPECTNTSIGYYTSANLPPFCHKHNVPAASTQPPPDL
ncbi:MAG: transglycosylase domain-containing protein [Oscillospiraceae bacterium]|jgi:penicillin-binding protein 1A|nr:transglycosylase domain-containing protein [Oscillospiraceae bacterium]